MRKMDKAWWWDLTWSHVAQVAHCLVSIKIATLPFPKTAPTLVCPQSSHMLSWIMPLWSLLSFYFFWPQEHVQNKKIWISTLNQTLSVYAHEAFSHTNYRDGQLYSSKNRISCLPIWWPWVGYTIVRVVFSKSLSLFFFSSVCGGDPISLVGAMGITPFQQGLVKLQGTV